MFPIRDHNPSGRTPFVTYALMLLNIGIFLSYVGIMNDVRAINAFYSNWAMIPARLVHGDGGVTLVASMFLHGGWMHLIGNMLFLWIFGDNIEDEMGHLGFIVFYVFAGLGASAIHIVSDPSSQVPVVGASGAIAGVMGGYILLFPKAKVDILLIFIVFFRIVPIPAWLMLALWFVMQFVGGLFSDPAGDSVAHWAHVGGFAVGVLLTLPLWLRHGGRRFWTETEGQPPHPDAQYKFSPSRIPKVRRK
ncbi:MAG: rhomboid family intramembrane serine protease [Paracoccaceae bacterium]